MRAELGLSAKDKHEDVGNGLVERGGNGVADLDALIERLRERPVLHQRNVVLLGDLADLEREQIEALRYHDRCGHGGFVAKSDRVVSRIRHHNGGSCCGFEREAFAHLAAHAADARLDGRIAVGLLQLVLDVLLGHLQVALHLAPRQGVLDGGPDQQDQAALPADRERNRAEKACEGPECVRGGVHDGVPVAAKRTDADPGDGAEGQQRLEKVAEALDREDLLCPRCRVHALGLELQRARRDGKAALRKLRAERQQHRRAKHRGDPAHHLDGAPEQHGPVRLEILLRGHIKQLAVEAGPAGRGIVVQERERPDNADGRKYRGQLTGARDAALLARLSALLRCRLFCLVCVSHRVSAPGAAVVRQEQRREGTSRETSPASR